LIDDSDDEYSEVSKKTRNIKASSESEAGLFSSDEYSADSEMDNRRTKNRKHSQPKTSKSSSDFRYSSRGNEVKYYQESSLLDDELGGTLSESDEERKRKKQAAFSLEYDAGILGLTKLPKEK
jgi:hypothetical protein